MLLTREATPRDGVVLQSAMTRSPQGSDGLVFTLVTAPDFFGRARAYDDAAVYGNAPSEALFGREGFVRHRRLDLTYLLARQHIDVLPDIGIRPAQPADLPAVATLLNRTWAGHDFVAPWRAETLAASLRRTVGHDLRHLLVREERGEIVACLGVWDWSAVQRIQIESITPAVQRRFPSFRAGEALRQWGLAPIGFRRLADLGPVLRHVTNLARAAGIDQIGLAGEPGANLLSATAGISAAGIGLGFWVKPLRAGLALTDRPVFVDIVDL